MFHASTTIRHNHLRTEPFSAKERRLVFAGPGIGNALSSLGAKASSAWGTLGRMTSPFRGAARVLALPITAPTRVTWWTIKQAYDKIAKPTIHAGSIVAGSAVEAAAGAKDAVWEPTKTLLGSSYTDIKANLWDLPKHLIGSAFKLPFELMKAPGRFAGGVLELLKDIPKNLSALISNTRQNVTNVLGNIFSLSPKEAVKSTIQLARDAVNDTLVNPLKSTLKPFSKPLIPLTEMPVGGAKILIGSKYQYGPAIIESFRECFTGLVRIKNAPGTELNVKAIEELRGEIFDESKGKLVKSGSPEGGGKVIPFPKSGGRAVAKNPASNAARRMAA